MKKNTLGTLFIFEVIRFQKKLLNLKEHPIPSLGLPVVLHRESFCILAIARIPNAGLGHAQANLGTTLNPRICRLSSLSTRKSSTKSLQHTVKATYLNCSACGSRKKGFASLQAFFTHLKNRLTSKSPSVRCIASAPSSKYAIRSGFASLKILNRLQNLYLAE